jgi:sensor c-di-GMP phosphodiesterase-like protein
MIVIRINFTTYLQATASHRSVVIAELRSALEKNEFELHYQTIIDFLTSKITQAEALLRWRNHYAVRFY